MNDAIKEIKIRAGLLSKGLSNGESWALGFLRGVRRLGEDEYARGSFQRKHSLDVIARSYGFKNFRHAREVLEANGIVEDFGKTLYRGRANGTLNHWFAAYEEARAFRERKGGYLLAYASQYFVVDADFIRDIGLDPDDENWKRMNYDWARPREPAARLALYAALFRREGKLRP